MNTLALIIGTVFIMLFSWFLSIKYKRYHGIVRFFAFESVFILALLNYKYWFIDPFSVLQLVSWLLLILCCLGGNNGFSPAKKKRKA